MKNVLLLPGARWQVKLAERLKALGMSITVVDPHPDAPCVTLANHYYQCDLRNGADILNFCSRKQFDAVLSDECDIAMPLVAQIGSKFGLPALSVEDAMVYTDKYLMRQKCREAGVDCPDFRLCESVDDAIDFFRHLNGPMIIKPIDSNASRGVYIVGNEKDIRAKFDLTLSYSRGRRALLAEEYVSGTEFTVDGLKTRSGQHMTLAISEKKHYDHNPNVASELLFTNNNERFDYEQLKEVNDRFVAATTLKFGLTHAEYKFSKGRFYQIEIAARGGGTMISSVIAPFMSRIDNYAYLIDCATGVSTDDNPVNQYGSNHRAAILKFFDVIGNGGRVLKICGETFLKNNPCIKEYQFGVKVGDVIRKATTDSDRAGFYIACCETKDELDRLVEEVSEKVRFEFEVNP
jgi:biotin carboxylase